MALYTSTCVACPPLGPAMVPYWPATDPSSPLQTPGVGMAALPPGVGVGLGVGNLPEAYAESLKRNTFYISDILYPSVIPLPGTLPQVPASGPARTSPHGSPSSSYSSSSSCSSQARRAGSPGSTPSPPKVRSSDLKFGIDRILQSPAAEKSKTSKQRHTDHEDSGQRGCRTSPSHTGLPGKRDLLPSPYCPCSSAGPTLLSYPVPIHYPPPPPAHTGSHQHPHSHPHQHPHPHPHSHPHQHPHPLGLGHPHHQPGSHHAAFPSSRPSEFPGPYAVLSSEPSSHQGSAPSKRKRSWSRAVFSHLQRKGLEKRFEVQKYVTKPDRRQLAAMLGLTDAQVKVWFQNRRMKWRHAEEAKRKKTEEDDNQKKEAGSGKGEENKVVADKAADMDPCQSNPGSSPDPTEEEGLPVDMIVDRDQIWSGEEFEDSDEDDEDQCGALVVDIDQ